MSSHLPATVRSGTVAGAIPPDVIKGAEQSLAEPEWIRKAADDHGWDWARVMWRRAAAHPGAWFDSKKADGVVARWPDWFKLTGVSDEKHFDFKGLEVVIKVVRYH
jgi:hypothetical protein